MTRLRSQHPRPFLHLHPSRLAQVCHHQHPSHPARQSRLRARRQHRSLRLAQNPHHYLPARACRRQHPYRLAHRFLLRVRSQHPYHLARVSLRAQVSLLQLLSQHPSLLRVRRQRRFPLVLACHLRVRRQRRFHHLRLRPLRSHLRARRQRHCRLVRHFLHRVRRPHPYHLAPLRHLVPQSKTRYNQTMIWTLKTSFQIQ